MSTLALDLGTKTGWAIASQDGKVAHGTANFTPGRHEGEGRRFLRFRAWLHDTKAWNERKGFALDLILYEHVHFIPSVRTGSAAVHIWGGMWATLTAWAEHHGIPYLGVATSTLKKSATGNGRAPKPAIIAAMRARGFKPASSDEADALALLFTQTMEKAA